MDFNLDKKYQPWIPAQCLKQNCVYWCTVSSNLHHIWNISYLSSTVAAWLGLTCAGSPQNENSGLMERGCGGKYLQKQQNYCSIGPLWLPTELRPPKFANCGFWPRVAALLNLLCSQGWCRLLDDPAGRHCRSKPLSAYRRQQDHRESNRLQNEY